MSFSSPLTEKPDFSPLASSTLEASSTFQAGDVRKKQGNREPFRLELCSFCAFYYSFPGIFGMAFSSPPTENPKVSLFALSALARHSALFLEGRLARNNAFMNSLVLRYCRSWRRIAIYVLLRTHYPRTLAICSTHSYHFIVSFESTIRFS